MEHADSENIGDVMLAKHQWLDVRAWSLCVLCTPSSSVLCVWVVILLFKNYYSLSIYICFLDSAACEHCMTPNDATPPKKGRKSQCVRTLHFRTNVIGETMLYYLSEHGKHINLWYAVWRVWATLIWVRLIVWTIALELDFRLVL